MQSLESLLDDYGQTHQHIANKIIHWLCVPVIVWAVVALLWSIPFPADWRSETIPLNWAAAALVLTQLYYFSLSLRLGLGLLLYNLTMLWITSLVALNAAAPLWLIASVLFVVAWIGQFIGHMIERARPAFLKDIQFLLIGPAWLMSALYRFLGLRQ